MTADCTIRVACKDDVPIILGFIRELAEFEKLSDQVTANVETLRRTLFEPRETLWWLQSD